MDCEQAEKLMSTALDGELALLSTTEFQGHLDDCEHCRYVYASYRALDHELKSLGEALQESRSSYGSLARLAVRKSIHNGRSKSILWVRGPAFAIIIAIALVLGAQIGSIFSETIWPESSSPEEISVAIPNGEMSISYVMANLTEGNGDR